MLKTKYILLIFIVLTSVFVKAQLPDAPTVDTVSVEPINVKGDVYISWEAMNATEIKGYIIYRNAGTELNPIWQNLDTIFGASNTFYLDANSNADGKPESYRLRSFDFADTKSLFSDSMITMYTFPYIEENNCIHQIRVHWTPYVGWKANVVDYTVYCSINDGPYFILGSVPGNLNDFIHTGVEDTTSYTYYVKAKSTDNKTSRSNSVRTFTDFPNIPQFINADYATVENSLIKVSYTLDDSAEVKNYRLMRSDSLNGNYITVKSFYNWIFPKLEYKDNTVDVDKVYYYKLDAIDPCGNVLLSSNASKNIEIEITNNNDFAPIITWDRYIDWLGGDVEYKVYRIINSDVKNIYTSYNAVNFYKDEIKQEDISKITGKVCYMVEAIEGDNNPYGVKGYSKSTIKCLEQQSYVVMPNAFTPNNDKINDIFKPLAIFISDEDYIFEIYNRWGEKIFSTNDITEGWTGRNKKKQVAREGVYFYILQYKDFYDEIHYLSGEVTLIF